MRKCFQFAFCMCVYVCVCCLPSCWRNFRFGSSSKRRLTVDGKISFSTKEQKKTNSPKFHQELNFCSRRQQWLQKKTVRALQEGPNQTKILNKFSPLPPNPISCAEVDRAWSGKNVLSWVWKLSAFVGC